MAVTAALRADVPVVALAVVDATTLDAIDGELAAALVEEPDAWLADEALPQALSAAATATMPKPLSICRLVMRCLPD